MSSEKFEKHNTFCLVMIVKNESKVIKRCLESMKKLIDYWVICDTGSTDGTQDIIKNYCKTQGIPGELYEHDWKDFGYNRSLSFKLAKGKADYLVTLDADEVYIYDNDFSLPPLNSDAYFIRTRHGELEYQRIQIVSGKYLWYYAGVLHEYIETYDMKHKKIGIIDGVYDKPSSDGARSSDPNKYQKDALVFEQALLDDPNNSRNVFYLAQSYRDCKDYDNAIKNYVKRSTMKGFIEETFYALYEVGLCKSRKGEKFENFVGNMLAAYNYRPERLEPVYQIVRYCRTNGMSKMCYQLFKHVMEGSMKTNDKLFVEKEVYEYKLLDELSVAASLGGFYKDSIYIINKILKENKYPKHEENRIFKNLEFNNFKIKNSVVGLPQIDNNNFKKIFTDIINSNQWGYKNQKYPICTGIGSSENNTIKYRKLLKNYIINNHIKSVIDVGCGIWEFYHNEFDDVTYIGIDCVKKVIDFNKERYASKKKIFIYADLLNIKNNIPNVDLCIIKDVLQHLSNENIVTLLEKVKKKAKYILLIQDFNQIQDNQNIKNGNYRPLLYSMQPLKQFNPIPLTRYWTKEILLIGDNFNFEEEIVDVIHEEEIVDVLHEEVDILHEEVDVLHEEVDVLHEEVDVLHEEEILLSILARNKAHVLPKYLKCIENLNYNKKLITIYINTNNNLDNTTEILKNWIDVNINKYKHIEFETGDFKELHTISDPHAWTSIRFKILGQIRNKSLKKTLEYNCDYYLVIDCDNFIIPDTLNNLISKNKPIIAPMLHAFPETNDNYSNFFCDIGEDGYYKDHKNYIPILNRIIKGTFEVPVVHCTYLIKSQYINNLSYIDESNDYEFIIFSRIARQNNIKQYICNMEEYGKCVHFYDENIKLYDEKLRLEKYELENTN